MKTNSIAIFAFSLLTMIGFALPNQSQTKPRNVYTCAQINGYPTTIVDTARGRIELIVWKNNYFSQSGWTPQRRCNHISQRFQKFSDNGTLRYVAVGTMNEQKIICVAIKKKSGIRCRDDGLLLTLEPKDDPNTVLDLLFNYASRVSTGGLYRDPRLMNLDQFLQDVPIISTSDQSGQNISSTETPTIPPPEIKGEDQSGQNTSSTEKPTIPPPEIKGGEDPVCPPLLCP
jgi:hypothetical protein